MENHFWELLLLIVVVSGLFALAGFFLIQQFWKKKWTHASGLIQLELQASNKNATLSLKLQAYERFMLLCERLSLLQLIVRLQPQNPTAKELQWATMLAIQQEFEHNITQRLYISESLWKIITLAKDNALRTVQASAEKTPPDAPSSELAKNVYALIQEQGVDPLETAQAAIREEIKTVIF